MSPTFACCNWVVTGDGCVFYEFSCELIWNCLQQTANLVQKFPIIEKFSGLFQQMGWWLLLAGEYYHLIPYIAKYISHDKLKLIKKQARTRNDKSDKSWPTSNSWYHSVTCMLSANHRALTITQHLTKSNHFDQLLILTCSDNKQKEAHTWNKYQLMRHSNGMLSRKLREDKRGWWQTISCLPVVARRDTIAKDTSSCLLVAHCVVTFFSRW